jgi:hypothetical protein
MIKTATNIQNDMRASLQRAANGYLATLRLWLPRDNILSGSARAVRSWTDIPRSPPSGPLDGCGHAAWAWIR